MENECIVHSGEDALLKDEWNGKSLFIHKVLVGLGEEWDGDKRPDIQEGYEALARLLDGKDYFIVTLNTDGKIFESSLDEKRIVAPCGNDHWFQCEKACTADIWEESVAEEMDGVGPHCGAPVIPNTVRAGKYIEEGYLPQWNAYKQWLSGTLNRKLTVLELGAGFEYPGIIRWPFEKTAYFNNKAKFYRVNKTFFQISEELKDKAEGIQADSVKFIVDSPRLW